MSERCGSYPLMNLAEDYGVAYGDVLLLAGNMRLRRVELGLSDGRFEHEEEVAEEIIEEIGSMYFNDLWLALERHSDARWGPEFGELAAEEAGVQ